VPPLVSVVVPVYNERESLPALTSRLRVTLEEVAGESFEILLVDDGSSDGSAELMDAAAQADPRVRVLHLSRNFGHQAALQAGLDRAQGRAVILMDADLQDPPELLPEFLRLWREGNDVVYAIRKNRKEGALKRLAYAAFYRTLQATAEIDTPLDAGDFCLLDARVVRALVALPERQRFLRGLRSWVGFRQVGLAYERSARLGGNPKYTVRKLVSLALSGYVGFSTLPLRLAAWLGLVCATIGFIVAAASIVAKLTQPGVPQGWTSTIAVILFIGGLQLIILGVIGEYLGRMFNEIRGRPTYLLRSDSDVGSVPHYATEGRQPGRD
jgi:glycosyltransferase involved in cell wall biosynthesis